MAENSFTRKLTKIAAFILGGIIVLLVSFHFWFVNHAEEIIENMVADQSQGKLKLQIHKFKFNWFSRKMELQQAVFMSTDTIHAPVAYRFEVNRIKVQVKQVLPIIFEKKFLIDSIQLVNPNITVTKLRQRDSTSVSDTNLSIPQEMGRIYNSIQDALQVLKVDRFQIDNGTFSLVNKTDPGEKPLVISRLYFHLDNLQVDTTVSGASKKILFSDDVSLHTTNQNILFPDGRHRLAFSNFRINIRNRLAEFDSCTIMASKGDSASSAFRIFFDKLLMTNIDFDTLYHTEVIKADSVYCINPRFRLDVDLPSHSPVKPPKLNEMIQQLTGNMQLAFVVVQNGSFDINTMRDGRPSSFTSSHNNFELQGLRIRENAARPLTVQRFAMAIRNYENFLRDSAYAIQFDSILINDNRISLNNFSYKELDKQGHVINHLNMPQFELQGLSWDDLVFDQQLYADRVTLYRPVINYNIGKSKSRSSKDVFQALADIGRIMQLEALDIVNGQVNLTINKKASLKLQDATMAISATELVKARRVRSIQRSVSNLHFRTGSFVMGDVTASLSDVFYNGSNNGFRAGSMTLEKKNGFTINASNTVVDSMNADEQFDLVTVNGLSWQHAGMQLSAFPGSNNDSSGGFILKNIKGADTRINMQEGSRRITVTLDRIDANAINLLKGQPISITGLSAAGHALNMADGRRQLAIDRLSIADRQSSDLENIVYTDYTPGDSIHISIPSLSITPDINAMLQGKIIADNVTVIQPKLDIKLVTTGKPPVDEAAAWKDVNIGNMLIQQPALHFTSTNEKGTSSLDWSGNGNGNSFEFTNLKAMRDPLPAVSAEKMRISMDHFIYENAKGKRFDAGDGRVFAQLSQLVFKKNDADTWDWKALINNLAARNFIIDSLGKKRGRLSITWAKLNDLAVNSSYLLNLRDLVAHNTKFNLREITASYLDADKELNWYNASYDKRTKSLSLDSFSFNPLTGKDAYVKTHPYQTDYMKGHTGAISIGPFDVQRLVGDTVLDMGTITINDGYMSSYRDKRVPREPGVVTLLPASILKKIPLRLVVDTVTINRAHIDYEEVNEKTKTSGIISIARLNGTVTNIRNYELHAQDSLRIRARAWLQDTIFTELHMRQSYIDTTGGFVMTGRMGPADLTILNPVLIPLASAELKSAKLDTMYMRVIGQESFAYGEMKMFYHDLKIRVIKPGESNKKTFFTGLVSFFANTIIKNKNDHRIGRIYFRRLRDRSAVNYLVKIALNGMTSSIGVKKVKKEIVKEYQPQLDSHFRTKMKKDKK